VATAGQRPETSYRPGADGWHGSVDVSHHTSAGVSFHLPNPSQPPSLTGHRNYVRFPPALLPAGFRYKLFPMGFDQDPNTQSRCSCIVRLDWLDLPWLLTWLHRSMADTQSSPILRHLLICKFSACLQPRHTSCVRQLQSTSTGGQESFSLHPARLFHTGYIYKQHPRIAHLTGRRGTDILQLQ
jgi:hypothetical protein